MPKEKRSKKSKETEQESRDSTSSTSSRPYVELLREKFLQHADPNIMLAPEDRVSLEWHNITYKVPIVKKSCCRVVEKKEKAILQNVSGFLPAGSLLGILGPSGAGKTTFLSVLSRRLKSKKITGQIKANGVYAGRSQFEQMAGFVAQDDVLMGSLTAEEALMFAAQLKLPKTMSDEEQRAHARSLLKNLGLEHVKDHLIGYTGAASKNSGLKRGLSGGERKRVSVCFEMVSNPKILFLDEPTSGLDSFAAKAVMENLRDLAFYGRTIVATIHQPSAEIFRMFDYLLLLADGQTVFYGPAHKAVAHFSSMGIVPPPNINPADFLLKAIHIPTEGENPEEKVVELPDVESHSHVSGLRAATHEQVDKLIEGYKQSKYAKSVNKQLGITADDDHSKKMSKKEMKAERAAAGITEDAPRGYAASYFKQFKLLLHRSFVNMIREPALIRARLFQSLAIALMAGLIWLRLDKSQAGASDRFSCVFFVMVSCVFGALNGPIFVFPSERGVFFREKSSNMYSTGIYYLSKYVVELPINTIIPFASTTITYWLVGFNDAARPWLIMCGFAILLSIVGHAVGMALTCSILDTGIVIKVQPLIILPLMLFAGFFINSSSVPKYFIWLEAISFLKYAFRGVNNAIFSTGKHLVFTCPDDRCRFRTGADVIKFLDLGGHPIYIDALILLGMGIGIHLLAFCFLYYHVKRR